MGLDVVEGRNQQNQKEGSGWASRDGQGYGLGFPASVRLRPSVHDVRIFHDGFTGHDWVEMCFGVAVRQD